MRLQIDQRGIRESDMGSTVMSILQERRLNTGSGNDRAGFLFTNVMAWTREFGKRNRGITKEKWYVHHRVISASLHFASLSFGLRLSGQARGR